MLEGIQLKIVGTVKRVRHILINKSEGLLNKQKNKIIDGNIMSVADIG